MRFRHCNSNCFYLINHYKLPTNQLHKEEEQKVIQQAKQNLNYFSALYDCYYRQIFLFVFKRTSDYDTSGDITSLIFMKAMANLTKYEDRGVPFSSWLYRIAINEVNMHFRKIKKEAEVPISEAEAILILKDTGAEIDGKEENKNLLIEVLNTLEEEDLQLIELRFFEKLSFMEIGEVFDISKDNAKVKVYRILKKIKQKMLDRGAITTAK